MRFGPSSGPGGQNVNKVSTRATLLFDFRACTCLSEVEQQRIAARCRTRLSADGRLRIVAQRERTQMGNRAVAEERLLEVLVEALHVEKPRRPTRPTAGSKRRRITEKRRQGEKKRQRGRRPGMDD